MSHQCGGWESSASIVTGVYKPVEADEGIKGIMELSVNLYWASLPGCPACGFVINTALNTSPVLDSLPFWHSLIGYPRVGELWCSVGCCGWHTKPLYSIEAMNCSRASSGRMEINSIHMCTRKQSLSTALNSFDLQQGKQKNKRNVLVQSKSA